MRVTLHLEKAPSIDGELWEFLEIPVNVSMTDFIIDRPGGSI